LQLRGVPAGIEEVHVAAFDGRAVEDVQDPLEIALIPVVQNTLKPALPDGVLEKEAQTEQIRRGHIDSAEAIPSGQVPQ
jgi:hypothetical protein